MKPGSFCTWRAALACMAAALAAWGCGGGVGLEGTGGGVGLEGTGSAVTLSTGPIAGFGSVVVNGVHYDNTNAAVDDLGGGRRGNADLQLGMVVEVQADTISTVAGVRRAVASRLRLGSELLGPVDSKNVAAGTLVVLGQTVVVNAATVFDDSYTDGLNSVPVTTGFVEVFGFHDAVNGRYVATRLQPRSGPLVSFRLRGPVSGLNTVASTFNVQGQPFTYAGLSAPVGLADGVYVRLTLQAGRNAQGQWVVTSFEGGGASKREAEACELKGLVTFMDGARPGRFTVNGTPVDASVVGLPAGLAVGVRVEVEGALREGTLVARSVKLETESEAQGLEFEGTVASVNTAARNFTLQQQHQRPAQVIGFGSLDAGTLARLTTGVKVEVKARLSDDRRQVEALSLEFED